MYGHGPRYGGVSAGLSGQNQKPSIHFEFNIDYVFAIKQFLLFLLFVLFVLFVLFAALCLCPFLAS